MGKRFSGHEETVMRWRLPVGLALGVIALGGCKNDQQIVAPISGTIALTDGDFDHVAEPFDRMVVRHEDYEGLISAATWDVDYDPSYHQLKVEHLVGDDQDMDGFGAVFLASGTRGFGARQYNGLEPDDALVSDEFVIEQVQAYVESGNVVVCTDWTYDLIERAWPDLIEFLGDDTTLDAAQTGEIMTVEAEITEDRLANALEMDTMAVQYNFSNWAVIEEVDDRDVTVWLRGDIEYRERDGTGTQPLSDVPLLVSMSPQGDNKGRVVFFTFHIDTQTDAVIDEVLRTVVGRFDEQADDPVAPIQ
jgi:hypothetical protein